MLIRAYRDLYNDIIIIDYDGRPVKPTQLEVHLTLLTQAASNLTLGHVLFFSSLAITFLFSTEDITKQNKTLPGYQLVCQL